MDMYAQARFRDEKPNHRIFSRYLIMVCPFMEPLCHTLYLNNYPVQII